jgi:biopolymer transport protein ExbB/TolQ
VEIERDEEALSRLGRRNEAKDRSALQWVLIIAAGALLANAISTLAAYAWMRWELQQAFAALEVVSQEARADLAATAVRMQVDAEARRREQAALAEQRRLANERYQASIESAQRTCDYWRRQANVENTTQNRAMRDQACALVQKIAASRR